MYTKDDIKRWRRTLHKEFRWWKMPSEDPSYRAGMVLATVYAFGTDVSIVSQLSGQTEEFVRGVLKQARASSVLVGQRLRVGWNDPKHGAFAILLDAMVAEGTVYRPPDPKRSAACKARPRGPDKKPRAKRARPVTIGVYTPKVTDTKAFYGLSEWKKKP